MYGIYDYLYGITMTMVLRSVYISEDFLKGAQNKNKIWVM